MPLRRSIKAATSLSASSGLSLRAFDSAPRTRSATVAPEATAWRAGRDRLLSLKGRSCHSRRGPLRWKK